MNEIQRAAAQVLGVSHVTIGKDLQDGKKLPKPKPEPLPIADKELDIGNKLPDPPPAIITQSGEEAAL